MGDSKEHRMNTMTKDEINSIFIISEDGKLFWKNDRSSSVKAGMRAGYVHKDGYEIVKVKGIKFRVHRIIYAYYNDSWPLIIDHKDRNKLNNSIDNLREASHLLNVINTEAVFNKHGYRGVQEHGGSYRANIRKAGKLYVSKVFSTPEEAHIEYLSMKDKLFGDLL